jgi:type VI secretion system secreted protein Hcp
MTRPLKAFWFSMLGFFGLHGNTAFAAITQVLCSSELVGESVATGATGCIDVLAWSWGASNAGQSSKPNLQDLSLTKFVDSASDNLFSFVVTANPLKLVVELRNYSPCASCASPTPNQTIRLKGVTVSSLSTGGSGGEDRLTENISLSFDAVSYCYRPTRADGTLGAAQCSAYSKTSGVVPPF